MSEPTERQPASWDELIRSVGEMYARLLEEIRAFHQEANIKLATQDAKLDAILKHLDGEHGSARAFVPYDPAGGPL